MDEKLDLKEMPSDILLNKFIDKYIFKDCTREEYQKLLNEVKRRLDCWQNLKDFLEGEK